MGLVPIWIPEIDYPLPATTGERVAVSIPLDWLPFVVQALKDITAPDLHTGGASLYSENLYKIDEVIAGLDIVSGGSMLIGQVITHALADVPDNLLICDGTVYTRTAYPDLYEVLHPNLIIDADTFQVPDLRDKFIKGEWLSQTVGITGGEKTHALTVAEMPQHGHTLTGRGMTPTMDNGASPTHGHIWSGYQGNPDHPVVVGNTGGNAPHNNEPQYYVLRFAIVASL